MDVQNVQTNGMITLIPAADYLTCMIFSEIVQGEK